MTLRRARRLAPCLFVGGTASDVGKSVVATAVCRVLAERGYRVVPFKAQNMSNNAAVAEDGREIGRAQAAQAEAAGVEPLVDMNPILLKPEADDRSQLIVLGRVHATVRAREYWSRRQELWPVVTGALRRLRETSDVVVIEGAGSVAELNLRATDVANMRLARHAQAAVLLVGDIERGGIFAQLLGTLALLAPRDRALVCGLLVNKFRGDPELFEEGRRILERRSSLPVVGVMPYATNLAVPTEDSQSLGHWPNSRDDGLRVAILGYPRISNFDDVDPLRADGIRVDVVRKPADLDDPDLIILPGSKATIADLDWLHGTGLAKAVINASQQGAAVLGICGGYQMLGRAVNDPDGVEGLRQSRSGLGLLPVTTTLRAEKTVRRVAGRTAAASVLAEASWTFAGYEIHVGESVLEGGRAFSQLDSEGALPDGCIARGGRVVGTYVHGLFSDPAFRRLVIERLAAPRGKATPTPSPTSWLESLSLWFRASADVDQIVGWLNIGGR